MQERLLQRKAYENERQARRKEEADRYKSEVLAPNMEIAKMVQPISDFGHATDVMNEALARYEKQVQQQNDERVQQRATMFKKIDMMNAAISDREAARLQKARELGNILESQVQEENEKKKQALIDSRLFVKPHFGPEDPDPCLVEDLKRQKTFFTNKSITNQIQDNETRREHNKNVERAEDLRAREINEMIVKEEDLLDAEHKKHKQELLKEAWTQQEEIRRVKDIADRKYAKLLV